VAHHFFNRLEQFSGLNIMQNNKINPAGILFVSATLVLLNGCATTHGSNPQDPWKSWNSGAQSFNDGVDDYVMKPVAMGYDWVMPQFPHQAVTNLVVIHQPNEEAG
jgi:ABC-type transporter lipoprotein component MlaA